jgi:diguanylate cyclase (GGDEF)-like protein
MPRILVAGQRTIIPPEGQVIFEAKGYQLIFSSSPNEAVNQVLEDPPDLLITELGFDGEDLKLIRTVKACLQKANMPILLVLPPAMLPSMDWALFPVDDILIEPVQPEVLLARVQLAESRLIRVFDNNPLSRLPGNTSIIKAIQRTLESDTCYGVCYIDIDNFKPYNDRYGFTQGDDVILMVARIAVNVVEELAREESFVGHVGGDDYVFIVPEDKVVGVCEKILSNFEVVKNMFISGDDIKAGVYIAKDRQGRETTYGLLSLSIAVVLSQRDKFKHYGEVSAAASQIKHVVKELDGSNYMIDRRDSYKPNVVSEPPTPL